jgi:hypothetical protein
VSTTVRLLRIIPQERNERIKSPSHHLSQPLIRGIEKHKPKNSSFRDILNHSLIGYSGLYGKPGHCDEEGECMQAVHPPRLRA